MLADVRYFLVCENEDTASYSVVCLQDGTIVEEINDIRADKSELEKFCDLLNRNKVSPIHFFDVFEDYM